MKPTAKQYKKLAKALVAKGYSVTDKKERKTTFKALEKANFKLKLKDKTYDVYASRIMAIMHEASDDSDALEL